MTQFVATKQIVYESGKGFSGLPAQVTAQTQTFTEGIGSTRGGLVGRIVRRRAAEQIAENKALTTEIVRQKAQRQIAAAFERRMDERIAHLNQLAESQSLWASLAGGAGRIPFACCSTSGHLQIAAAHPEPRPISLPVRGSATETAAPVELWIHGSLVPKTGRQLQNRLAQASSAGDMMASVVFPAVLIKKQALSTAAAGLMSNLACQMIDDWVVVEMLPDRQQPVSRTAAAPAAIR